MKKKAEGQDETADLPTRLNIWLHKTGLPLELATQAAFRAGGFDVEHSTLYIDPDSGKGREIDVVAWRLSRDAQTFVQFNVECKASPNPWIVVCDRRHMQIQPHNGMLGTISRAMSDSKLRLQAVVLHRAVFPLTHGGYILRQAFSGDNDPAYSAAISVVKSTKSLLDEVPTLQDDFVSVQPVIVVDSKLFECEVGEDGSFALVETDVSCFSFTSVGPASGKITIRIATREGLPKLVQQCEEVAEVIIANFRMPEPGEDV